MLVEVNPLAPPMVGVSKAKFWLVLGILSALAVGILYLFYATGKSKKNQKQIVIDQDVIKENLSANVAKTDIAYEALEKVVATPEVTAILVKNNQLSADVVQSTSANNTQLLQPVIVGRG